MLTFKAHSTTEDLHVLTESVIRVALERGCTQGAVNTIQLVLEELLTNIRVHAYPDHTGPVELDIFPENSSGKNQIKLCIRDWGVTFDPVNAYPSHDLESELEDRAIGGLGVRFVHSLSKSMEYRRLESEAGGMNSLTLILSLLDRASGN